MSYDDDGEENAMKEYLQYLVDSGNLEGAAKGVALQVIDQGLGSLIGKQVAVFKLQIEDAFLKRTCKTCGADVALADLDGYDDGGRCGDCRNSFESF